MNLKTFSRIVALTLTVSQAVKGDDGFIVKNIQINGLQRISAGTVYNYLPVNVGERLTPQQVPAAIRALFKTGFFKDITLERQGSTLVVNVTERPSIAKIAFEGNKDIKKEDLLKALKHIGLTEGKVFNQQVLEKVQQELRRQYFSHGKYGLKIKTEVTSLTRNRVGINIKISEGRVAKIKEINIVGNKTFDNETLQKSFELSTTNLLSFYTKDDQYSKQKLSADLERLRSFYLDRGYINFSVESTQVAITPDKKEIYITVNVKEGDVFTLSKVKLTGNLIVEPEELIKLVQVGPGEIFSRKNATETSKAISDRLGDDGYLFANVNMVPEIDDRKKTVEMTFFVDPGKRVYVRHITMKGNTKTRDEVLRREMRQMESSWASTKKIERSKARLERLGFFKDVNVETPPVVGSPDQIDVNYTITEKSSGNLTAGAGYSQAQGIILNANISQNNVFGTGKQLDLSFNNSSYMTNYQLGFLNPYYTLDGVSLGYNLSYRRTNAQIVNIASYLTNVAQAGMNFGIPLNESDRLQFSVDLKHTGIKSTSLSPPLVLDYIKNVGSSFVTLAPTFGWTHNTLNRAIFPTRGGQQSLSALATVPGSSLDYYKINYLQREYFPIASDLTLGLRGEVAYGNGYGKTGVLPFFEHFFAGGVHSLRGFRANTLGPRQNGYPIGGSTKMIGSVDLFFPVPFMKENKSFRIGTFFDFGTLTNSFNFKNIKYSAGISGEWMSPFGAIAVSIAQPFNATPTDSVQRFQFSFGTGF